VQNAGPLGGIDEAEIDDDEIECAASEFEDAQQGFEWDGLALLGAQGDVQRAGEDFDSGFMAGEEAGEQGFVAAVDAFECVEPGDARLEIEHQADLAEGARKFEKRNAFGGELRKLHGEIQGYGGGADAAFAAGDND